MYSSTAVHLARSDCEDGDSDTDWFRYTESYMLCALSVQN